MEQKLQKKTMLKSISKNSKNKKRYSALHKNFVKKQNFTVKLNVY